MNSHQGIYIRGQKVGVLGALDGRTVPTDDQAPLFLAAAQILPKDEPGDYYVCRIVSGGHSETAIQVSLPEASEFLALGLEDYSSSDAYGMIHRCFRHPEDSNGLGSIALVDGAFAVTADLTYTWGAMQDLITLSTSQHDSATDADKFASVAHQGQTDEIGRSYIEHPRRVALRAANMSPEHLRDRVTVVALLHETVQYTATTLEDLRIAGFSAGVIDSVRILTKTVYQSEEDFFTGIRRDPAARIVKTSDLIDKTDPDRLMRLDDITRVRLREDYTRSWALLMGFTDSPS